MFFQFDFKINLKELKDFLYTIQLYVEIPDYYAGTRMCNSVRLIIHEQGPKVDWEVVHETSQNYHSVLEFLRLPTGFFNYLKTITLCLKFRFRFCGVVEDSRCQCFSLW